ncbi:MAG: hypothetical protein SOZ00_03980, partial [Tidjanibacter sp.]|nr:hypothetical protein [Tidjanibacter sp.]
ELLESHSCVKAVICGHNHTGNYICRNGIHHITIKGMVESTANRFAIVSVSDDHLAVKGFGDQPDYDLSI